MFRSCLLCLVALCLVSIPGHATEPLNFTAVAGNTPQKIGSLDFGCLAPPATRTCLCGPKCRCDAGDCRCLASDSLDFACLAPHHARNNLPATPVVTLYGGDWCGPCKRMESAVGDGDDELRLHWEKQEYPAWLREVPAAHWITPDGRSLVSYGPKDLDELKRLVRESRQPSAVSGQP